MPLAARTQDLAYTAAVLALSALYYGLYLNSGFATTDDGSYAQIAYELFLGRNPRELAMGYGIAWFKIGEGLFHLFGVHYVLVKLVFFTAIAATNVLIFHTLARFSGSNPFALAVTMVTLIVPAFPATAFYGLCVMLNAAAQMRLALRLRSASLWDAAVAGVALSLSFQIRPDFGYAFAAPLALLFVLASRDVKNFRNLVLAALAGFGVGQIPIFVVALIGAYADFVLQQYFSYPAMMLSYVFDGVLRLGGASSAEGLLQRPGLGAAFAGDQLAILIYAPFIVLAAFVAHSAAQFLKERKVEALAPSFVALFAAAITVPHYFFYRPDLSHIANFMPGFVLLAGVFMWQLHIHARAVPGARPWAGAAMGLLILHLAFYVWVGVQSPATGSIAAAKNRTEQFQAGSVTARVSPAEKHQFTLLQAAIEANSQPGDRIVCVPYCPGLAFMTGRRMLFGNFYVDDATAANDPTWIPGAIAQTQEVRPPVIIVMDWAVNGTEISRFDNWAAAYVAAVKELARETIVHPGIVIYLL